MYTIKAALMLDSSGDRIVARYFPIDQRLRSRPEQVEFEKALFGKTARQNGAFRDSIFTRIYPPGGEKIIFFCFFEIFAWSQWLSVTIRDFPI
jgi:hypothetical protein